MESRESHLRARLHTSWISWRLVNCRRTTPFAKWMYILSSHPWHNSLRHQEVFDGSGFNVWLASWCRNREWETSTSSPLPILHISTGIDFNFLERNNKRTQLVNNYDEGPREYRSVSPANCCLSTESHRVRLVLTLSTNHIPANEAKIDKQLPNAYMVWQFDLVSQTHKLTSLLIC